MNTDKERELFERWANSIGSTKPDLTTYFEEIGYGLTKMYLEESVQLAWEGFQARAALLPSVEEIAKIINDTHEIGGDLYGRLDNIVDIAQAIRKLLEEPQ